MSFEKFNRFLVLKWEDVIAYLSEESRDALASATTTVERCRAHDGKKINSYIVINEDESYAEVMWKLIEMGEGKKNLVRARVSAYFEGMRTAVRDYAVWKDGKQYVGMGRPLADVLGGIDAEEREALGVLK